MWFVVSNLTRAAGLCLFAKLSGRHNLPSKADGICAKIFIIGQ